MPRRLVITVFLLTAAAGGCKSSRSDLVEAELRYANRQLREVAEERDRLAALNEAFSATLRGGPPCPMPGRGGMSPIDVRDVQIGRGTGGIDEDNCSGDEGILVVLVPRDADGSAVKAAGQARITVVAVSPEGLKAPVSTWTVTDAYLKRNWKAGLLSSGYFISLPWLVVPPSEKLRIVAQFQTVDGAVFEAERDVQVRLPHLRPDAPARPLDPGIIPSSPAILAFPQSGPAFPPPGGAPPTSIPAPPKFDPTAPLPPPTPWHGGPELPGPTVSNKLPAHLTAPVSRPPVVLGRPQP
jgi:hypothetical protein